MRKKLKKIEEYAQESQCLDEANKQSMKNFKSMLDNMGETNVTPSHYGSVKADNRLN